jgi:hypothetical protein
MVVERAVRNRSDALLAAFRSILTSGTAPPEQSARDQFLVQRREAIARFDQVNPLIHEDPLLGYLEASFLPEHFDPSRFTLSTLRAAAEHAQVTYTGWPFLFIHQGGPDATYVIQDGWETLIQTQALGDYYRMDFWRFQQSGFFYHRTILRPYGRQVEQSRVPAASLDFIAVYVAEAIDCLTRLYDGLFEDNEYMSLDLRILNTEGRALVRSGGEMPLWGDFTCRIPEILVSRRLPLADWRAAVVEHAIGITKEIYLRFNWTEPNIDIARNTIQRMFARQW